MLEVLEKPQGRSCLLQSLSPQSLVSRERASCIVRTGFLKVAFCAVTKNNVISTVRLLNSEVNLMVSGGGYYFSYFCSAENNNLLNIRCSISAMMNYSKQGFKVGPEAR